MHSASRYLMPRALLPSPHEARGRGFQARPPRWRRHDSRCTLPDPPWLPHGILARSPHHRASPLTPLPPLISRNWGQQLRNASLCFRRGTRRPWRACTGPRRDYALSFLVGGGVIDPWDEPGATLKLMSCPGPNERANVHITSKCFGSIHERCRSALPKPSTPCFCYPLGLLFLVVGL